MSFDSTVKSTVSGTPNCGLPATVRPSPSDAVEALAGYVAELVVMAGLASNLKALGVAQDALPKLAAAAPRVQAKACRPAQLGQMSAADISSALRR